jgi:hypothetical protein
MLIVSFSEFGSEADFSRAEIPQRRSLLPTMMCYRYSSRRSARSWAAVVVIGGAYLKGRKPHVRKRREFVALLGGAVAWPVTAHAQQPSLPVIGYPSSQSPDESATTAIRRGLNQTGYFEAKNVVIEFHYAEGQYDRHQVRDFRSPAANSGRRTGLT